MAGGGPVTGLLAARAAAAAALLAGHRVAAVAVERGGGGERGGSLTYLKPVTARSLLTGEVEVKVTGGNRPGSPWDLPGVVAAITRRSSSPKRPRNRINFPERKTTRLFAPRCQLIPPVC